MKFNLGMLGAGDSMYVQAAYAQGAASYLGTTSGLTGNNTTNYLVASDAIAVGPAGSLKLGEGYNVLAAIDHYWAPNFDTALWAGYTRWDYNNGALTGVALAAPYASTFAQARDFDVWQVGAQATWVPVKGIKFAGTVNYYNVNAQKASQDFLGLGWRARLCGQEQQRRHPGRSAYPARLLSLTFSSQGDFSPGAKAPGFLFVQPWIEDKEQVPSNSNGCIHDFFRRRCHGSTDGGFQKGSPWRCTLD